MLNHRRWLLVGAGVLLLGLLPLVVNTTAHAAEMGKGKMTAAHCHWLAKEARAKAAEHEQMGKDLQASGINPKMDWQAHCNAIASLYRKLAEEHEAMAKELE